MEDFLNTKNPLDLLHEIDHWLKTRSIGKSVRLSIRYCLSSQPGLKRYECTDCQAANYLSDNNELRVGFCSECGHPLWNPSKPLPLPSSKDSGETIPVR